MAVSKVTLNGLTLIDITDTTATSSKIQVDYGAYGADGKWIDGALLNLSGYAQARSTVCEEQEVVPDQNRTAILEWSGDALEDGEWYIVAIDGTEYVSSCELLWSDSLCVGSSSQTVSANSDAVFPFFVKSTDGDYEIYFTDTDQHVVKVEHLDIYEAYEIIDGDNLEYGTAAIVGISAVGSAVVA